MRASSVRMGMEMSSARGERCPHQILTYINSIVSRKATDPDFQRLKSASFSILSLSKGTSQFGIEEEKQRYALVFTLLVIHFFKTRILIDRWVERTGEFCLIVIYHTSLTEYSALISLSN